MALLDVNASVARPWDSHIHHTRISAWFSANSSSGAGHQFLSDDISFTDEDVPTLTGHRQVTDAHLLTLARRRGVRLVTEGRDVEVLTTL